MSLRNSLWWSAGAARIVIERDFAATLREQMDGALLFRSLARLRTVEDGVPISQRSVDELEWRGAPQAAWHAFCDRWGLTRLRDRPHRWRAA